ncbi:hypothetical protein DFP72DRAFT_859930 [Ephemerocybe angulata]|uniref:C2H2-type domain-containing protein n=1 Tax=Ephemerocybe angulata TaxID=980116 RepID=A0A8H6LT34_9AGAR|nr:hypothetical protein DFP72DRAFT_859930 [Tulosesus angulatus]
MPYHPPTPVADADLAGYGVSYSSAQTFTYTGDVGANWCENCGKNYSQLWRLDLHQRSCTTSKRGLSYLLEDTREYWETKKRLRLEASHRAEVSEMTDSGSSSDEDSVESEDEAPEPALDLDVPLAIRKAIRTRSLPMRYRQDPSPEPDVQPIAPPKPDLDVPTPEHTSEGARSGATATLVLCACWYRYAYA